MTGRERSAPYAVGGKARALHWDPERGTCLGDLEVLDVYRSSERPERWYVELRINEHTAKVVEVDRWGRDRNGSVYPVPAKGRFGGECGTDGCARRSRWIPITEAAGVDPLYRCEQCCDRIAEQAERAADPYDGWRLVEAGYVDWSQEGTP